MRSQPERQLGGLDGGEPVVVGKACLLGQGFGGLGDPGVQEGAQRQPPVADLRHATGQRVVDVAHGDEGAAEFWIQLKLGQCSGEVVPQRSEPAVGAQVIPASGERHQRTPGGYGQADHHA